jgi:hypothetical protein
VVLAEYDSGRVDGCAVVAWLARDSVASEVNDPSAGSEAGLISHRHRPLPVDVGKEGDHIEVLS